MHIDVFILYLLCSVLLLRPRIWYLSYEYQKEFQPPSVKVYDIEGTIPSVMV